MNFILNVISKGLLMGAGIMVAAGHTIDKKIYWIAAGMLILEAFVGAWRETRRGCPLRRNG